MHPFHWDSFIIILRIHDRFLQPLLARTASKRWVVAPAQEILRIKAHASHSDGGYMSRRLATVDMGCEEFQRVPRAWFILRYSELNTK